jgi:phosphoglycerate kinase
MNLPVIDTSDIQNKKIILRADLDVDPNGEAEDIFRLKVMIPTINALLEKKCQIVIIGHKGRPEGKVAPEFSLKPVAEKLSQLLAKPIAFQGEGDIIMLENLRFDPGEEKNDPEFAKKLSSLAEFYVNDAFTTSHRNHASIVGIPRLLPHAAGLRLALEVKNLGSVFTNPKRPVIAIIGGAKEDKLNYIEGFKKFADKIHIVGALPKLMEESGDPKVVVARLLPDKEDITIHSMEVIEADIASAGTIIVAGPVGKYEDEGHRQGTQRIFQAIASSSAFKIAGGGDTQKALSFLGIESSFDWVSVGGGATLEFLAKGTLPGIEALKG